MTGHHLGYIIARELGDDRLEPWETDPDRCVPVRATAWECREEIRRHGANPDVWHVVALVDLDAARPGHPGRQDPPGGGGGGGGLAPIVELRRPGAS